MANATDQVLPVQMFYGGQSSNSSIGPKASFSYGRALEFRRDPSQLTVLPGPRKISGAVVTDLPLNIVQVVSGDRYAFGDTGNFYKISTSNVVTEISNTLTSGSDGLLYRADSDAIYMATQTTVERYAPISGSPTFDQTYGNSKSIDTNAYRTSGAATYTVPTSISETATNICTFEPDIEPFYSIKVKVVAKGTGNWTLTLHDGLNTVLGSVTIASASLNNTALNEFVFASQIRGYVKPNARTYHFHLTSTVADGTVQTTTASDLDTADFELWAYRLVNTVNGLHPMAQFLQYTLIGNGNYLAVWEPLSPTDPPNNEFQRHRLTFPDGFEVCGITPTDEFAVIACEKRSTDGTKDFQEGKLFIWDGSAQTYNQIIDVSGGSPESIYTYNNYPYFFVNGSLCAWLGGKNIVQIRALANTSNVYTDTVDNTHCYPNMMTVRDNLLHLGYPSSTTNVSIEHGVYTWGTLDKNFPNSFGYGYVISTQTRLNTAGTLQIGCVRNFGDEMYISWKDGTDYGIDIVDSYCNPAPTFAFRAMEFDAGLMCKTKKALRMSIDTLAIPSGVTITPIHSIDNGADVSHDTMTAGSTEIISTIQNGLFKNIVFGFDGACSGADTPTIKSVNLLWNGLPGERMI
jgi:hypothetical protein